MLRRNVRNASTSSRTRHGHCALHLPERGPLLVGDAVVTLDPLHRAARAAERLRARHPPTARRPSPSLDVIPATGAEAVLTGHGPPWTEGAG